ncbi:alpha-acetolactate decarboxylase [Aspergillus navahoensis]
MAESNQIYQYSVISALAQGLCMSGIPAAHVLSKGDHGIGTLASLDGELVIIESEFTSTGGARPISSSDTVPFIIATYFKLNKGVKLSTLTHEKPLSELLHVYKFSKNKCLPFRIEGFFS